MGAELSSADALRQLVWAEAGNKAFGEFTRDEVRARGAELSAAVGWGPTARVASVARAWSELARFMTTAGVERVADLGAEDVERFARALWVLPPGGSLL